MLVNLLRFIPQRDLESIKRKVVRCSPIIYDFNCMFVISIPEYSRLVCQFTPCKIDNFGGYTAEPSIPSRATILTLSGEASMLIPYFFEVFLPESRENASTTVTGSPIVDG